MSTRRIIVDNEQIGEESIQVQDMIGAMGIYGFFNAIDRGKYGSTLLNIQILETLERALAVLIETSKQMKNLITSDRGEGFNFNNAITPEDQAFVNLFSLFAMAVEALERAESISDRVISANETFKLREIEDLIAMDTAGLPTALLADYRRYVDYYRNHSIRDLRVDSSPKILYCSISYFKKLRNSLFAISRDTRFNLYRTALQDVHINILGKYFDGFTYAVEDTGNDSQLLPVKLDEIIGNEEYVASAVKLAKDVAGFDFETGDNPKKLNPIIFALGNPGCGKTVTAHAVGNYFLDFCKQRNIRARFVIIRRSDWASSYQNASAKKLIDIFKNNVLGYRGVVGIYWPDIDTAFSARTDSGLRSEEKNILGAVFGLFDGTILPKNGQWFMMCDANYLNMDKATISRITQDPHYVKGPQSPEDFIKLFRDIKLFHHRDFLTLTPEEWQKFGTSCAESELSGRSIENIARKVVTLIEDFETPDEYYGADINRKREIIRQYSNRIDSARIDKLLSDYIRFEKSAEEKASQKRFEDRVDEIRTYLSAKKHVLDTFMEEDVKTLNMAVDED